MKLNIVKQDNNSFMVAYDSDLEKIQKLKKGEIYQCEIKRPRNLRLHNKFMALVRMVYRNQEHYSNFDDLRKDLTIAAGFYEKRFSFHGEEIIEAQSLEFGKMNDEQFGKLYSKVIDQIILHFNFEKELILSNVERYF